MGYQAEDEVAINGKGQEMVSGKHRTTWCRESRESCFNKEKPSSLETLDLEL